MTVLGVVPYLNAVPLLAELPRELAQKGADPAVLARWLREGSVDAALLPVAEGLSGAGDGFLGHFGIACDGHVESVLAFVPHEGPPSSWPRHVVLDPASRTSVALLRVLLERAYGLTPTYVTADVPGPDPAAHPDAVVLAIGDRALHRAAAWRGGIVDLGAAWKAWTGLPFVFARWTARRGLPAADRGTLARALDAAAERGILRTDELAQRHGPAHGIEVGAARRYLGRSIRFRIGPAEEAGLARFAEELGRIGGPRP
ncbi:MAG: menaquinone biosynthesis protein [Planctomycetes bacterium]|nr:menaquinone biosynthesis protein [Planctomycetota bacterium]